MQRLDVAILGGGMAGALLARQLLRADGGLRVGVFERATERDYRVGESTVELGSHYLVRRVGLTRYLYENHLPKNGLRYFFDDPERSLALPEMAEIGSVSLPFHPAFQIDRQRFDTDVLAMDAEAGAEVRVGARVRGLTLGEGGAPHRFEVVTDGSPETWEAAWLVDASGRAGLVAKARGLRVREAGHRIASVWGRFEGVADVDDLGPEAFRSRVRHTSRGISTLHFCYPGYWVWFIRLRGGVTSVGVVGDPPRDDPGLRTPEGFRAFLDGHAAIRELLRPARAIDTRSYAQLAYASDGFLSARDRWGMTGEAAVFADPLYSPGTDFIALENDFLSDLIVRERGGEDAEELERLGGLFDRFLRFRLEAAMLLYRGQYGLLGSAELMRQKWDFDLGFYYNLWVASYMQDLHLDPAWLRRELRQSRFVLRAMANFSSLFRRVEARLREDGHYYRGNRSGFHYGLEHIDFVEEVGRPRSRRRVLEKTAEIMNAVYQRTARLVAKGEDAVPGAPLPLTAFVAELPLP